MSKKIVLKKLSLLTAGILLSAQTWALDLKTERTFNIPPQQLRSALLQFATQAKVQVMSSAVNTQEQTTAGVNGKLSLSNALDKLLQGTGLQYRTAGDGTIMIVTQASTAPAKPEAADGQTSTWITAQEVALAAADIPAATEAAEKAKPKSNDDVEEMIVEENRIKPFRDANVDIPRTRNDPQPYYIFDSETIERSAALSVDDFLKQRLTMNATAQMNGQRTSSSNYTGNSSSINLRGLGADKTLVLINGRRIAGTGWGGDATVNLNSQTDLNGIPVSAIDRIEVLPSSASGIYGGNAMGGVVNVVLKKSYSGGEVRLTYENTLDTDSPARTVSGTYGIGLGKTQVMLTAQLSDAEPLLLQDRRELFDRGMANILRNSPTFIYTSTNAFIGALPNITSTGEVIYNPDGSFNSFISDPGVLALRDGTSLGSRSTYIPAGTVPNTPLPTLAAQLYANRGVWNLELPRTAQNPTGLLRQSTVTPIGKSVMLSVRRELRNGMDLTFDYSHNQNTSSTLSTAVPDRITVSRNSAFNPFNSAVSITNPNNFNTRARTVSSFSDSASLGVTYKFLKDWVGQMDYTWSLSRAGIGYDSFDSDALNRDIASGAFNPFADLLLYPATTIDRRYYSPSNFRYKSTVRDIGLRASGPLPSLPWGTPSLTAGVEHRLASTPENASIANWPLNPSRDNKFFSFPREQLTQSLYAEASVPLVKQNAIPLLQSLDLQLSGRSERYRVDTGTAGGIEYYNPPSFTWFSPNNNGQPFFSQATYTSNSKTVGFKYQPVESIIVRASTATAFLPPTPAQLVKNVLPNNGTTTITDPRNNNSQIAVRTISGGNPDLRPQSSKSFNAGLIWQPAAEVLKGLRFNAEYYKIEQLDAIGSLSAQLMVNNESEFPDRVTRNSAGVVTFVDISSINLYKRDSRGWDLSLDYAVKTDYGNFELRAVESIILNLRNQYSLTQPSFESVGFPSEGGAAKYKSNLQLTWDYRNLVAGWSTRYFGSYKQYGVVGGPSATQTLATNPNATLNVTYVNPQGGTSIPSQMYHDLFVGYSFEKARSARAAFSSEFLSGVTVQLGVKNVFNTLPPFDVFYDYYISPYGDTRLRSYWLSAKKAF